MNPLASPQKLKVIQSRITFIPPSAAIFAYILFLSLYGNDSFYQAMALVCGCTALGWTTAVVHPIGCHHPLLYIWYTISIVLPIPLAELLIIPVGGRWYGRTIAMISLFGIGAIRGHFILFDPDSDLAKN